MRRGVTYLMTLFALLTLCGAVASEPKGADIELSQTVIDLGTLSQSDDKQHIRLSFLSCGDVPLVITEVRTSCSCTTIKYDRKPLPAGEQGVLNITVDPSKAPEGNFYRVIQVYSTAISGVKNITLKANIKNGD